MKNVRKYRPGLYQARCCINGKKFVAYGKTPVQAYENMIMKKQNDSLSSDMKLSEDITFAVWFEYWIKNYKEPSLSSNSVAAIKCCYRNHITETFRLLKLKDIKVLDIERELNKIEKSRTKKYTQTVITGALRKAYKLELIVKPIFDFIETSPHVTQKGSALSLAEQRHLVKVLSESEYGTLFLFYLYSGARRSEALSIKKSDINWKNDCILIPGTKTEKSYRFIPLFPELKSLLSDYNVVGEYLFPFNADFVSHKFKEFCPGHKLHDLRHTFATRCLESGVPIKVVQEWLGHSTYNLTADTYSHVSVLASQKYAQQVAFNDCSQFCSQKSENYNLMQELKKP